MGALTQLAPAPQQVAAARPPPTYYQQPQQPLGQPTPTVNSNTGAYGNVVNDNGVAVRSVNPNELTSDQLLALENQGSPLMQLAASQGANAAAATGNANGTLMAGASQNALLDKLTPIAAQNAQVYERGAQANQDAYNQSHLAGIAANAQIAAAGEYAGAQRYSADVNATTLKRAQDIQQGEFKDSQAQQLSEFNNNWDNTFAQTKNNQNWQSANEQELAQLGMQGNAFNTAIQTIFSDPSYWNDPQGALGMIKTFGSNIGDIISSYFGTPTYQQQAPTQATGH